MLIRRLHSIYYYIYLSDELVFWDARPQLEQLVLGQVRAQLRDRPTPLGRRGAIQDVGVVLDVAVLAQPLRASGTIAISDAAARTGRR
jgi:hypothetical protein